MAEIDTILPFPHLFYEKSGWRGIALDVLVVRATYDLGQNGQPMRLAATQTPLVWGDEHAGPLATEPLAAVLQQDGDLVVGKPCTDIMLQGTLHCPHGQNLPHWQAGVQVGPLCKRLQVNGPRVYEYERRAGAWRCSAATPITQLALDYRLAFGGRIHLPGAGLDLHYPFNPAGIGWLPAEAEIDALPSAAQAHLRDWLDTQTTIPAPQFEDPDHPVQNPYARLMPQGFGPIARWWQPRLGLQGTLDAAWQAERYPAPADDYDPRFAQCAHPDLICTTAIQGDEYVTLENCLPEGTVNMQLPGIAVQAMTTFADGKHLIRPLMLDTIRINLDQRQCVLLWRTQFARSNRVRGISIIALQSAEWQTAVAAAGMAGKGQP